jgi:hypothetical protein
MSARPTSTLLRAAQSLKAPSKRPPLVASNRDQEIFKRVEIHGERQCAITEELGLDPSRISQIVSSVRRWLAQGGQGDAETLTALEQRRLARSLAQARHEAIYALVMREAARQEALAPHKTVRTRIVDGQEKSVTTTLRDQRLNVQLLKAAQRSAMELERLAEREPIPDATTAELTSDDLYDALFNVLYDLREEAEDAGRVAATPDLESEVETLLATFLGRSPSRVHESVGDKIRQAVARRVRESAADEMHHVADGDEAQRGQAAPNEAGHDRHETGEAGSGPRMNTDSHGSKHHDPALIPSAFSAQSAVSPSGTFADRAGASAQHEQTALAANSASEAVRPAALSASPAAASVADSASGEEPTVPPPTRKKPSNMSPQPPVDKHQRRSDRGHEDSGQPPDDRIPIVLHAWTYRDGTPIR